MTISSATLSRPPPPPVRTDSARTQKDNGDIGRAQQARDNTQAQKAVAQLRKDTPAPAPPQRADRDGDNDAGRETKVENAKEKVGSALNVKA